MMAMDPRMSQFATQVNGFWKLDQVDGLFVKQKMDLIEALTGCELPNRYYVYELASQQGVSNFVDPT